MSYLGEIGIERLLRNFVFLGVHINQERRSATVAISWYEKVKEFKSPIHVIAAILLRSRETQVAEVRRLSQQVAELQSEVEQQQQQLQQQQERIDYLRDAEQG